MSDRPVIEINFGITDQVIWRAYVDDIRVEKDGDSKHYRWRIEFFCPEKIELGRFTGWIGEAEYQRILPELNRQRFAAECERLFQ